MSRVVWTNVRMSYGWNVARGVLAMLLLALATPAVAVADQAVTLVEDGEAHAVIVLPAEPGEDEQRAARELIEHIELISGVALASVRGEDVNDSLTPIRLGGAADAGLEDEVRAQGENSSAFALVVDDEGVAIRGLSEEGTLFGAYELLEQLGVRWYHPGDLGRVLPEADTLTLEAQRTIQVPSMDYRLLGQIVRGEWLDRARLGGDERSTGSHGIPPLGSGLSRRRHFENNPEFFGLVDGERINRQVCVSNPDLLDVVVEHVRERLEEEPDRQYWGMGPNDGHGYCECEDCQALDQGIYDPFYDRTSMTDRYVWFFNQLLDRLEDDHPDLHIVWYVYQNHMMPPEIDPNPRLVHVFAPIAMDRIGGMDNPMSPDRHVLRWLIDEWSERDPNEMYYRGYYNPLACPQFPFSQIDRIRHETPVFHEKGIRAMRVQAVYNHGGATWAGQTPHLYLAARMMWDVDTDVDALLEEFYDKFYGPAREPMKQYHEALESAFRDTPYYAGSSYPYFPIFLHHPRRDRMRVMLDEATSAAEGHEPYAERVWSVRTAWDRLEAFLDMIDARNSHDFAAAYEHMQRYYELSDELVDYVLEAEDASERYRQRLLTWSERSENDRSMFNRFFRDPVVSGYERAVEDGEIVTTFPDAWDFLLDPAEIGTMAGYHRPGELGGNWEPIKTYSRSWSDQGLHYYKGVAWYRTSVDIPAEYEGEELYLWFGGVDHIAHVWINGKFIGTSDEPAEGIPGTPGSFDPFDMPATDATKPGEENWVVVKIENRELAELGTGGILAPVMFWSPTD